MVIVGLATRTLTSPRKFRKGHLATVGAMLCPRVHTYILPTVGVTLPHRNDSACRRWTGHPVIQSSPDASAQRAPPFSPAFIRTKVVRCASRQIRMFKFIFLSALLNFVFRKLILRHEAGVRQGCWVLAGSVPHFIKPCTLDAFSYTVSVKSLPNRHSEQFLESCS